MYSVNDLSRSQKKVYLYIKEFIDENNYPPSVRDICSAVSLSSTSTVHGHLRRLEEKGLIKRGARMSRAIELVDNDSKARAKAMAVPIVGSVTAGQPILAEENIDEYIPLPEFFVRDENSFILIVKGESMINAGIFDGDYILVRKQTYADDGDIIVAMIQDLENEATVKRFYDEGKYIRLQPENDLMEPIMTPYNKINILGKVTGLFRRIK